MPALTVGIPVFNGMPYLPEAVDSLLQQTFRDFELLVIDDGSTDDTLAYLETIRDVRLRVISQPNSGLSATLNRLLIESKGAWHVRQDADDISFPTRLEQVVDAISHNPDAGMFYSPAAYHPASMRGTFRSTIASASILNAITRSGYLIAINHTSAVLNVEKTIALGAYRTELKAAQDQDLWWRMALHHDVQLITKPTVGYRLSPSGLSSHSLLRQSTEVLYCQYLLLSELWGLQPRTFAEMEHPLKDFVDMKLLRYRARLRSAGINYSEGAFLSGLRDLAVAGWIAPGYLLERLRYEYQSAHAPAVNGISPLIFAAQRHELWNAGQSSKGDRLVSGKT